MRFSNARSSILVASFSVALLAIAAAPPPMNAMGIGKVDNVITNIAANTPAPPDIALLVNAYTKATTNERVLITDNKFLDADAAPMDPVNATINRTTGVNDAVMLDDHPVAGLARSSMDFNYDVTADNAGSLERSVNSNATAGASVIMRSDQTSNLATHNAPRRLLR